MSRNHSPSHRGRVLDAQHLQEQLRLARIEAKRLQRFDELTTNFVDATRLLDVAQADRTALLKVAQALLMFYQPGPWTVDDRSRWTELTGAVECTTKSLCDFTRKTLEELSK